MKQPAFTAEASLYRSDGRYATGGLAPAASPGVVPAYYPWPGGPTPSGPRWRPRVCHYEWCCGRQYRCCEPEVPDRF